MSRIPRNIAENQLARQERLQGEDISDWLFWKDDGSGSEAGYVVDEERKRAVEKMAIPGISALKEPQNRANLLSIYLLMQSEYENTWIEGFYPLDGLSPDPSSHKGKYANQLKKFLLNEDNLPKDEWQRQYLDTFGRIYQNGSKNLDILWDLSDDWSLDVGYQRLCLLDSMNIVGQMIGEIAKDCSPEIREDAMKILDEKKDFYDHVHRVAEAAKQRLEFYKSAQGPESQDNEKAFTDEQLGQLDRSELAKNVHARMVLTHCNGLSSTEKYTKQTSLDVALGDVLNVEDVELFLSDPVKGEKRTEDAMTWFNNTGRDEFPFDRRELLRCHEKNQEKQRRQQMSGFLEGLKESDPWYHINSQSYKKVFSGLEEVNRLCSLEPGKDRDRKLKTAYESLYEACNTYLEDKTPENRKTSLGKKRVEMIQTIREAVSPEPAREAAPSEPARTAPGVIQASLQDLQDQSSSLQNGAGIDSGNQRQTRKEAGINSEDQRQKQRALQ